MDDLAPAAASTFSTAGALSATEPVTPTPEAASPVLDRAASEAAARRAFSTSVLVSATRCMLTYVVPPFVAPVLGIAADVGSGLGITIGLLAIGSNVLSIRRFHAAQHRWRWAYTAIALCVMIGLTVLLVEDVASLVG